MTNDDLDGYAMTEQDWAAFDTARSGWGPPLAWSDEGPTQPVTEYRPPPPPRLASWPLLILLAVAALALLVVVLGGDHVKDSGDLRSSMPPSPWSPPPPTFAPQPRAELPDPGPVNTLVPNSSVVDADAAFLRALAAAGWPLPTMDASTLERQGREVCAILAGPPAADDDIAAGVIVQRYGPSWSRAQEFVAAAHNTYCVNGTIA